MEWVISQMVRTAIYPTAKELNNTIVAATEMDRDLAMDNKDKAK
jgi:hypothetical protein